MHPNERAPADLVLLWTSDPNGSLFIRTDQLDGETDWKVKRPLTSTQTHIGIENSAQPLANLQRALDLFSSIFLCEQPSKKIYEFLGLYEYDDPQSLKPMREPMTIDNTMWANTVLASQHPVLGLVIYTGRQTRSQMNQRLASIKMCYLDQEVNFLSKLLFVFLLAVSLLITALNGFHGHWLMFYFRVMLLLSSIIPISVRINLDLAKLWYSHGINTDNDIRGTIARNSNIPEELGRIQFLISDKTGTLTQNVMVCRKIFLEYSQFSFEDNQQDMTEMLQSSCTAH